MTTPTDSEIEAVARALWDADYKDRLGEGIDMEYTEFWKRDYARKAIAAIIALDKIRSER